VFSNCLVVRAGAVDVFTDISVFVAQCGVEWSKWVGFLLSSTGAVYNGDFTTLCDNFQTYVDNWFTGEWVAKKDESGGITYPEELVELFKKFLETQKDSSGNFKDSNVSLIEYDIVQTAPLSDAWANYYQDDGYLAIDAEQKVEITGLFDLATTMTDYKNMCKVSDLPPYWFIKNHNSNSTIYVYAPNINSTYYWANGRRCFLVGYVENGLWKLHCVNAGSATNYTNQYCYMKSHSFQTGKTTEIMSGAINFMYASNNSTHYKADGNCIPCLATLHGDALKVFATVEDGWAYYEYIKSLGLDDGGKAYNGGDVYINKGTVIYNYVPTDDDDDGDDDDSGGGSGGSSSIDNGLLRSMVDLLTDIKKKLNSIYNQLVLGNIISGLDLLLDAFNTLMDGAGDAVESVALLAESKFPLSLPFDMYLLLSLMEAEPVAPEFEIPFKYQYGTLNIDETVKIDMSKFDKAVEYLKYMEMFLFTWGLLMLTVRMVNVGKGDS